MVEAVELQEVSVGYGRDVVLEVTRLCVGEGEMLALLGPSGSGKSTLLNAIAGFLPLLSGQLRLQGRISADRTRGEPPERRDVGFVFQDYGLWPHLTALDTVAYPLRRRGVGRQAARTEAQRLLDRLAIGGLAARRPSQLSGGQQQRVGLARALARQPALYLFDEPTAHLDTHVREVFLAELAARRRETGAAAIYATHDAAEALSLADRVALLVDGRVLQVGSPRQVYAEPVSLTAARLTGPVSRLRGGEVVRPDWAQLGGDRDGRVREVWFRGAHTDYALTTDDGDLLIRTAAPPAYVRGEAVKWSLRHTWRLPGQ